MLLLGAALTVAAAISTWIATAHEDRVRLAFHAWGDSISSLLVPFPRILQARGLRTFNDSHPPHPDNFSTCLFASGKDGSPVLVRQKLPQTNYSQFKLLLLPEDSRTLEMDPLLPRNGFRWCRSPSWNLSAVAIVAIVAWILCSALETHLKDRHPAKKCNTLADAAQTIDNKDNHLGVDAHENERKKTLSEWFTAILLRGHQMLHFGWESLSDNERLDRLHATNSEAVEGQPRPNDEEENDTAWMNKDEVFEADHDKNVLDLENEIERSLTDAALQQKRIALIKEKDVEIESLRKKLDFTTGKFRDFQREHEECRTRNALRETQ